MLNDKGFDLWADGYDKSVGISDEGSTYPFAGYKKVLGYIFQAVMEKQSPTVLDIGFGTGTQQKCRMRICIKGIFQTDWLSRCAANAMILL